MTPRQKPIAADSTYPSTPVICPAKRRLGRAQAQLIIQQGRRVQKSVAVNAAKPRESGIFQTWESF